MSLALFVYCLFAFVWLCVCCATSIHSSLRVFMFFTSDLSASICTLKHLGPGPVKVFQLVDFAQI